MKLLIAGATLASLLSPVASGLPGFTDDRSSGTSEPSGASRSGGEAIVRIDLQAFRSRPELLELRNEIPILPEVWSTLDALVRLAGRSPGLERGRLFILQRPVTASGVIVALLSDGAFDSDQTRAAAVGAGWRAAGSSEAGLLEEPGRPTRSGPDDEAGVGSVLRFPGAGNVLFGADPLVRPAGSSPSTLETAYSRTDPRAGEVDEAAFALIRGRETIRRAIGEILPPDALEMLADYMDLDELRVSVAVREGVTVSAVAVSAGDGRAGAFADASRAVLGLSKLAALQGDDPETLAALRSIRIEQDGSSVLIRAMLPDAFLRSRLPTSD